jgi:hypothetical protein
MKRRRMTAPKGRSRTAPDLHVEGSGITGAACALDKVMMINSVSISDSSFFIWFSFSFSFVGIKYTHFQKLIIHS